MDGEYMKNVIVIHYAGEITLKGANRSWFEGLLMKNIRNAVPAEKIIKNQSRIIIGLGENSDSKKILENLSRVFGISWYATAIQTDCTLEKIGEVVLALTRSWPRIPIRVETKRADKSFPLTSMQVNEKIGRQLKENGFPIDLTSPEKTVYIEILGDRALVFTNRQKAWDGMPVGSAGRVVCLFSGGIDSPVAAWQMMKRGCMVDYLHVHALPGNTPSPKIKGLLEQLRAYHPAPSTLYMASHDEFYKKTLDISDNRYELILFRRFLMRLGSRLGIQIKAQGLVTGDNLGQVASQTLENLHAANTVATLPVYRPLLTYNKQEIVDLAKQTGTYELSIQPYKDCCSLVAIQKPAIRPMLEKIEEIEGEIGMEQIVEETLKKVERIGI